jgi:tetratricopeptide (TPR) repeat protein
MHPEAATALTPERWRRIEAIFHAALQIPESSRADFLAGSCDGDRALLAEMQRLLFAFEDEKRFQPPATVIEPKGRLGETIGGYKLDAELGQGGMGTVYLAHRVDGEFDQQVALKVVSSHLRTQFFTERFRTERQILAGLNHAHITRLLDGGVSALGDPYLAMEYVDGVPVDRYCDDKLLAVPDRIRLFLQACSAVEYAHRNLVVHRDLKPGNVLVAKDGNAKLLDFGTAKLLLAAPPGSTTTRFRAMTPRYASPEQLRGEPVSTSMDVYSLGVMLYELATGAWPFGDPDSPIAGLERAVRDIDPRPPGSVIADEAARLRSSSKAKLAGVLDGDLRHVIARAIEADSRRRYASVEQLSADLQRYLAGRPVLAREHTWLYRAARFAQRHRRLLAAAAVLTVVLGFAILTAVQEYGREQRRMVQVRNLSQSYLTDILNEVGKLPGSMKARMLIVDRARKNLDQLLPEAPNDPELRRALASAYLQLADIQGLPFTISLGDTAGAIDSYRKAEAMAEHASAEDWESLAVLSQARTHLGQIRARVGQLAEALPVLTSAIEPAKRLWQHAPRDFQVRGGPAGALYVSTNLTLGYTLLHLADDDNSEQRYVQAIDQFRRALKLAEELHAAYPGTDLTGGVSQYLGFALEGLGHLSGNPAYFKESAVAHQRAVEADCAALEKDSAPLNQRTCADALGELSWALHRVGEGEPAVAAATRALALMQPVARSEPDSPEAQEDLADAYFHLGAAENTAGRSKQAIIDLRKAESLLRAMRRGPDGDVLDTTKLYVDVQRQFAVAFLQLHHVLDAIGCLQKAIMATQGNALFGSAVRADLARELAAARARLAK